IRTGGSCIQDFHLTQIPNDYPRSFTPLIDLPGNLHGLADQTGEIIAVAGSQHVHIERISHNAVDAGFLKTNGRPRTTICLFDIYPRDGAAHLYDLPQPTRIVRTPPEMR